MTSRGELLALGRASLQQGEIPGPFLDASLLLAHLLNLSREKLLSRDEEAVDDETASRFEGLITRRLSGESIAMITGRKEFRGLSFLVGKGVLIPRPDTETLVEAALGWLHGQGKGGCLARARVLDLCTGSGAVAIALKHECPGLEVFASDISPLALEWAKKNALAILGEGAIAFYEGDLFDSAPGVFSLITANAPYIKKDEIPNLSKEVRNEPLMALDGGGDGLDIIRRIIEGKGKLAAGGRLLLEADPGQMSVIAELLKGSGYTQIEVTKDLAGLDRVIGGTIPYGR